MTAPKEPKNTLRYKHMVARLSTLPPYKKEAALLQEIARGRQWRMDAAIEAINANPVDWNYINITNVMKMCAMFGRLATVEKLCDLRNYKVGESVPQSPVLAAFHVASQHGRYRTADAMAARGAGPDYDAGDRTVPAIHSAVKEGDLRKLDYLLKKGADKDYALYLATAHQCDMKIIRHLVEKKGAGVNFASEGFWTPFLNAVKHQREELVDYLLAHGATPQNDKSAGEALYAAVGDNNVGLVRKMLNIGIKPGGQTLEHAIFEGKLDAARVLVAEGGSRIDTGKQEPLLLAIVGKSPDEAVKFCLDNGARPQAALEALNADAELYRYGQRDKMKQFLESYLAPKPAAPEAPQPPKP